MFATATMRIAEATLIDEDDPSRGRVVRLSCLNGSCFPIVSTITLTIAPQDLRIGLHVGPVAGSMMVLPQLPIALAIDTWG